MLTLQYRRDIRLEDALPEEDERRVPVHPVHIRLDAADGKDWVFHASSERLHLLTFGHLVQLAAGALRSSTKPCRENVELAAAVHVHPC